MSRTKIKPKGGRIPRAISVIEIQILDTGNLAVQTKIRPNLDKKTIEGVDKILDSLKKFLAQGFVVEEERGPLIEVVQ